MTILPFAECSVNPADAEAAMTPDTRLVVTTHGSTVLGSVRDINRIGEILHDHGAYVIVAAHRPPVLCRRSAQHISLMNYRVNI